MKCARCEIERGNNFRLYSNGNFRSICKICDNENDKYHKKKRRKNYRQNTFKTCYICNVSKCINDLARLKKNINTPICLVCYPKFLQEEKNRWCRNERKKNISYRLKKSLAIRLRDYMSKDGKRTLNFIGCDMNHVKSWLQYNFTKDMTWENYGSYWNIDHIIPCKHFNFRYQNHINLCWNWSNLSPKTVTENSSKKDKISYEEVEYYKDELYNFLNEKGSETKWFSVEHCVLLKI